MRFARRLAATLAVTVAAATFAFVTPSPASAAGDVTNEVGAALSTIDARDGTLVADAGSSVTDSDSAAETANLDVPTDPTKGVTLKSTTGKALSVKLPGVARSDRGKRTNTGAVVYAGNGNSLNAAVPTADGSAQLWTYIRNRKASETYRYCVQGIDHFQVLNTGAAIGFDATGKPLTVTTPPTATEKKTGKSVPTSYTADGNCLIQYVAHQAKGTQYPLLIDPYFRWYWNGVVVTLSRADMATLMYGGSQALIPLLAVPGVGWGTIVGVLWVTSYATWAYANHKCGWFWLPYWGYGASTGWYDC